MIRLSSAVALALVITFPVHAASKAPGNGGWARAFEVKYTTQEVAVVAAQDGSFVIVGDSYPRTQVVRVAAAGTFISSTTLELRGAEFASALDGGDILIGGRENQAAWSTWLVRLSPKNEVRWAFEYAGVRWRAATAVGRSIIVAGSDAQGALAAELADGGSIRWLKRYDRSSMPDFFSAIAPMGDGFIAAGYTECGAWLVKMGAEGEMQWQRCHRRGAGYFRDVIATADGGILAVGRNRPAGGGAYGIWLVKTDGAGAVQWARGSYEEQDDEGLTIAPSGSGWIVVAKRSVALQRNVPLIFKLDAAGEMEWQWTHGLLKDGGQASSDPKPLEPAAGGGALFATYKASAIGGTELRLIRMDPDGRTGADCALLAPTNVVLHEEDVTTFSLPIVVTSPSGETVGLTPLQVATAAQQGSLAPFCTAERQALADAAWREKAASAASAPEPLPSMEVPADIAAHRAATNETYLKAHTLLEQKNYDELERFAAEIRQRRPSDPVLGSHLERFYQAIYDNPPESIEAWVVARPKSALARIALASALYEQGRMLRGLGVAGDVTPQASKGFERYRGRAREELRVAERLGTDDPEYLRLLLEVTDWKDGEALVEKAWLKTPYMSLLSGLMRHTLPKAGGTNEDRVRVLELARRLTGSEGVYALLAREAVSYVPTTVVDRYAALGLSWSRVRDAFRKWTAERPQWREPWHMFARLAADARDFTTLAELFTRPELAWGPDVETIWTSKNGYLVARQIADHIRSTQPSTASPAAPPPSPGRNGGS